VTSVEPNATRIGARVLRQGGNAVDAAVAVAYALAVTHPSAGNLGGGGFMLVRLADGTTHAVDFRETAPASATTEGILAMIRDSAGFGYRSAAIPGTVAGMSYALAHWGSLPLKELVQPAIDLARKGHRLGVRQGAVLGWAWPKLKGDPDARRIFGHGKTPRKQGEQLRQPELAKTIERIAEHGDAGFYEGVTAQRIARAMRAHGGLVTEADLRAYRAKERTPLHFTYRGFEVDTMPPPSMGGVAFALVALELQHARAYKAAPKSARAQHLFIEAARRAYAERRTVGADPDFNTSASVALAHLLDPARIAARLPAIDPDHATASAELRAEVVEQPAESQQTTHFSVVDALGNAVSCTYTLSASYGAKVVVPETGVVLNNSLGAFSATGVNTVASGKRMASSMTPTLVSQAGKLVLVLGSPGGDTIPNTVAQVFRNLIDWNLPIDEAVAYGRLHMQWLPDRVRVERLTPPPRAVLDDLKRRGHAIDLDAMPIGDANNILIDARTGVAWGYADPREGGRAEGVKSVDAKTATTTAR
jgi:gamma-glutamyltranspeptidase/glutathione hydrolase